MSHPQENCVSCCGGPVYCYRYSDKGVPFTQLPNSAFKRNGLQDNVFSPQGTIRYLCQSVMEPCCCPDEKAQNKAKYQNQTTQHVCCTRPKCAEKGYQMPAQQQHTKIPPSNCCPSREYKQSSYNGCEEIRERCEC